MLKIEKFVTASPEQWEIIIEGMRNPMINLPMQSTGARNMASNSTRSTKMFRKFSKHLGLKLERYTQTYMSMIEQLTWK